MLEQPDKNSSAIKINASGSAQYPPTHSSGF